MRLTQIQQVAILNAFKKRMPSAQFDVYLYGSRVRDDLKGGDIDLLLVTTESREMDLRAAKYGILAELDSALGEQKIDIVICTQADLAIDPFLRKIFPTAVKLSD